MVNSTVRHLVCTVDNYDTEQCNDYARKNLFFLFLFWLWVLLFTANSNMYHFIGMINDFPFKHPIPSCLVCTRIGNWMICHRFEPFFMARSYTSLNPSTIAYCRLLLDVTNDTWSTWGFQYLLKNVITIGKCIHVVGGGRHFDKLHDINIVRYTQCINQYSFVFQWLWCLVKRSVRTFVFSLNTISDDYCYLQNQNIRF